MRAGTRSEVLSAVWVPFLVSRTLVWVAGVVAMLVAHEGVVFDPPGVLGSLGHVGNIVAAPAVRWDAVWYLTIAQHGYSHASLASFFPLYPLSVRVLAVFVRSTAIAGIVVPFAACFVALCFIYRLAELDFGTKVAAAAVWVVALFPMSFFLSAAYGEALFLAFSTGSIYYARRGRWAVAGLLGGLAAATRSVGVLLVVPLAVLYAQARRASAAGEAEGIERANRTTERDAAWIALVPVGLGAYMVGLGIARGTPFAMLNSRLAHRAFALAPVTVIRQVKWSVDRLQTLIRAGHVGFGLLDSGLPELAFLALAIITAVGVTRRLNSAYAAYVIVALLVLLSEPAIGIDPLTSFPRYILVLFPLWIWLALAVSERPRFRLLLAGSTALLVLFTGQFATWHFVA